MTDTTEEDSNEWPNRGRFRKKYQPYGVRICEETIDEIRKYEDCTVIPSTDANDGVDYGVGVDTRESRGSPLWVTDGDWIMEDSEGCHYPVADDEMRQTYEPVDEN